jgi:O-succinylbenzoic acid--CoA ligase
MRMQDWLAARAAITPERTALITASSRFTFGELDAAVAELAGRLASGGIEPGQRVAALLPSGPCFVRLVFALARLQAVLVPLNSRLTAPELRQQLQRAQPELLLYAEETAALVHALAESSTPACTLNELAPGTPLPAPRVPFNLDATQAIIFTSGTTGVPKGAMLSFSNHFWSANASAYRLGVAPADRWLSCLPLYHVGGLAVLLRSCLYGTAVLLEERFDVTAFHAAIDSQRVTLTSLVPTMLHRLLETRTTPWPASLRLVLLGGAAASSSLIKAAQSQGLPVATTYGLTEAASQVATALPTTAVTKPGTVGRALLFSSVRIIDDAGETLPAGEVGQVVVRGPTVMQGYLDDPEATAAAIRAGELHTGDMGYLDQEGDLWVVQRRSELIVSGGENVYPAEVEQTLEAHPAVAGACVVGLPDVEWGERVAALVQLQPGATLDTEALLRFAGQRLAGYKRPRVLDFTDQLPQTASGKIERRAVRARLAELAAQSITEHNR